jgi:TolB-like protein
MKNVTILFLIFLFAGARLAAQEKFYNYYDKGLKYAEKGDWERAIVEFKSAISLEFEDKHKKRTYGTRFIEYYPHRELGIAYFHAGEPAAAKAEIELSIAYKNSNRAQEYLHKIQSGAAVVDEKTLSEIKRLEDEEKRLRQEQEQKEKQARAEEERLKKEREEAEKQRRAEEQKAEAERLRLKAEEERLAREQAQKQKEEERKKIREEQERNRKEQERLAREAEEKKKREEDLRRLEEEAKKKQLEEKKRLEEDRARVEREKARLAAQRKKDARSAIDVGQLAYDPTRIIQVGSRLSLAILPFENIGGSNDLPRSASEKLITELVNLRRFRVIERAEIDKVMQEQDFRMSDAVDEKQAATVGKLAGADVIVIGTVKMETGYARVGARLVDVETGETIVAQEVQTQNATMEAIDRSLEALSVLIYNDLPIFEGYIVSLEGDQVYIDIGSERGVRKGMKCVAFKEGDAIVHPVTKEVLGKKVTKLGEMVVTTVQPKLSVAKFIEKEGEKIEIASKVVIK